MNESTDEEITDEEMYKIFSEHENAIIKDQMEQEEKDNKILDIVKSKVSKEMFEVILTEMKESECAGYFEIVNKPCGDKQVSDYMDIKLDVWIDQTVNGGYSGDHYEGFIYVRLNKKEYLKWYYNM